MKKKNRNRDGQIRYFKSESILFRFALDMDICIKQTLVSQCQRKVKNIFLAKENCCENPINGNNSEIIVKNIKKKKTKKKTGVK